MSGQEAGRLQGTDGDRCLATRGRGSRTSRGGVEQDGGRLVKADGRGAGLPEEALGLACPGGEGTCAGDDSGKRRALSSAGRPERGGSEFPQLGSGTACSLAFVNLARSRVN